MSSFGDITLLQEVPAQSSTVADVFVMVAILVGQNNQPVIATQEFTSLQNCQIAATVIAQTTKQKIDLIKCVKK